MNRFQIAIAGLVLGSGVLLAQNQSGQSQGQGNEGQQQVPPAAQSGRAGQQPKKKQAVTGKSGNQGTQIDVTTTGSAGQETPGVQTNLGVEQQPGKHPEIKDRNAPEPNPRQGPGAPPNWEQVGQDPNSANTGAAAAGRAEIGGSGGGTLGVDAMPQSDQAGSKRNQKASGTKRKGKKSQKAQQQGQPSSQQSQPPL